MRENLPLIPNPHPHPLTQMGGIPSISNPNPNPRNISPHPGNIPPNPRNNPPSPKAGTSSINNAEVISDDTRNARDTIGIFPVWDHHIRHYSDNKEHTKDQIYRSPMNHGARIKAVNDYLETELKFKDNEIVLKEVKSSSNYDSGILWIPTDYINVKKMFARMVQLRNHKIKLYNYFPPSQWNKKIKLEILL